LEIIGDYLIGDLPYRWPTDAPRVNSLL